MSTERPINSKSFNWLILRIFQEKFFDLSQKHLKGRLIDIGCGIKPYKAFLSSFVSEHIGVDHQIGPHDKENVDLIGTAYSIPVKDSSFDSAICTAVLEHLEEPERALKECHRVLKPNGIAIYSVPFIWHLHEEPRDFYRYSKYGLKYLFEKTGFEIVELIPLSGFIVTFTQLLLYYLQQFNKGILGKLKVVSFIAWLFQNLAYKLNRRDSSKAWTWMYIVVARKI